MSNYLTCMPTQQIRQFMVTKYNIALKVKIVNVLPLKKSFVHPQLQMFLK